MYCILYTSLSGLAPLPLTQVNSPLENLSFYFTVEELLSFLLELELALDLDMNLFSIIDEAPSEELRISFCFAWFL